MQHINEFLKSSRACQACEILTSAVSNRLNLNSSATSVKGHLPSSIQSQGDLKVGEDRPEERLDEADWEPDQRGGQHKSPGREEKVVPLLEEHGHSVDGEGPARKENLKRWAIYNPWGS